MNTQTRLTDISYGEERKNLTEFKDGKYQLDFGYAWESTIYIETEEDTLLLITTQGTIKIHLDMLRNRCIQEEFKGKWFELKEVNK